MSFLIVIIEVLSRLSGIKLEWKLNDVVIFELIFLLGNFKGIVDLVLVVNYCCISIIFIVELKERD